MRKRLLLVLFLIFPFCSLAKSNKIFHQCENQRIDRLFDLLNEFRDAEEQLFSYDDPVDGQLKYQITAVEKARNDLAQAKEKNKRIAFYQSELNSLEADFRLSQMARFGAEEELQQKKDELEGVIQELKAAVTDFKQIDIVKIQQKKQVKRPTLFAKLKICVQEIKTKLKAGRDSRQSDTAKINWDWKTLIQFLQGTKKDPKLAKRATASLENLKINDLEIVDAIRELAKSFN